MVITKFDTKLGDKFITKSGDHQICHKISHKIWWKIGQQFVNYIQWHISHQIFCSPNLSPYFAPNLVFTKFGNKCITKFGDHQIWHLIRWQSCHQIWWTPNLSPNLVTNSSPNLSPNYTMLLPQKCLRTRYYSKLGLGSSLRGEPGLTTFGSQGCPWKIISELRQSDTHWGGTPANSMWQKKTITVL